MSTSGGTLKKAAGSFQLWGMGVGLVISGEYYGWEKAGTIGLLIAAALITIL